MRILLLTDDLPPAVLGGSGRIAWETSKGLQERDHDVTILTAGTFPPAIDGVRIRTVPRLPHRWAHYRSVLSRKRQREITAIIEEERPDLVHAHGLAWQLGYRWIAPAQAQGIRVVHTFHGVMHVAYGKVFGDEPSVLWRDILRARWTLNPVRNILARRMLQRCDALLSVSDALRLYLEGWGYHSIQTLHNGIDAGFWAQGPAPEEARAQLGLPPNATLFLLAGRIGHDKGLDAVRRALPEEASLLLAGEGDRDTWRVCGDRVRFFPNQNPREMRTLYAAASATLVPSIYLDPFPTVCLESMMCGTPVVATCHGGAKESVRDGVTGWIVDPRDGRAFAKRLRWCTAHPSELKKAGIEAKKHAIEHFSLARHLDRLFEIYDRCTANSTPAAPHRGDE